MTNHLQHYDSNAVSINELPEPMNTGSPLNIRSPQMEIEVPNEVPPFNGCEFIVSCISSIRAGTRSEDRYMMAMEKWVRYKSEYVTLVTDQIELPKNIMYFFIARYTTMVLLTINTNGKLTCLTPVTRSRKEDPEKIYSVFELRLPDEVTTSTFTWTNGDNILYQVRINTVEAKKEEKSVETKEKSTKKGKKRVVETVRDDSAINLASNTFINDSNNNNNIEPMALSKDTNSIDGSDLLKSKRKRKYDEAAISRPTSSANTVVLIPQNVELAQKIDSSLQTQGLGKFSGDLGDQRSFWYREIVSQHRNVLIHKYGDTVPPSELSLFLGAATEVLLIISGHGFKEPLYLIAEVINTQRLNWTQKELEQLRRWPCGTIDFDSLGDEEAQDIIFQIGHAVKESQNLPVSGLFVDVQNQGIDQQLHRYLRNWLGASQLKEVPSLYFICLEFSSARLSGYTKAHAHQVLDEQIGTDNYNPEGVFNGCVAVCISGTDRLRWLLALQHKQIRDKLIERGLVLESISELCLHDVEQLIVREDNEPYREQLFDMLCRMQGHGIPRYFQPRDRLVAPMRDDSSMQDEDQPAVNQSLKKQIPNSHLDFVFLDSTGVNIGIEEANMTEEKGSHYGLTDIIDRIELQVISGQTEVVFSIPSDRSVKKIKQVKIENAEQECIATAYKIKKELFYKTRVTFTEDITLPDEIRIAVTWKDDTHSVSRYYLTRLYYDHEPPSIDLEISAYRFSWKLTMAKLSSDLHDEESYSLTEDQLIRQCIKKELLFILRSITTEDLNCCVVPKQRTRFVKRFWKIVTQVDSIEQDFITPLRGKSMDWIRRVVRIYHFVAFENWVILDAGYRWQSNVGKLLSISAVHLSALLSLRADEKFSLATYYADAIEVYLVTVLELMQSLDYKSPTSFMTWAMYLARIRYMRKNGLFNEQTRGEVQRFFRRRLRVRASGEIKIGAGIFVRDYSAYRKAPMLLIESYTQNDDGEEEMIYEHIIAQDNVEHQSHIPFLPKLESNNDKAAKSYYPMTVPSSEKPVKHQVVEQPSLGGRTALENMAKKFNYEELATLFEGTIATYKSDLVPTL